MTYCQADLLAIVYNESRFDCNAVGDSGSSFGCFQIYMKVHCKGCDKKQLAEKIELARDFRWAAAWTLNRMVLNYWRPRTVNGKLNRNAIARHNGGGQMAWNYALNAVAMSELFIKEFSL